MALLAPFLGLLLMLLAIGPIAAQPVIPASYASAKSAFLSHPTHCAWLIARPAAARDASFDRDLLNVASLSPNPASQVYAELQQACRSKPTGTPSVAGARP